MEKQPKVFVIVLNYNGKDCLKNTLTSLFLSKYSNFEVVLVDNASDDGSLEEVRGSFPRVMIIKNSQNVGFAAGVNVGIKYALERGADYVLLLNYDIMVDSPSDFLSPLVAEMEKNPKIGLASPVILSSNGAVWFSGGKINWLRMRAIQLQNKIQENYLGSDYISGCAMLIRATIFREVGLLDEKYFLYYEDADFSVQAKKAGYELLVCPESRLKHLEKSQENSEQKTYHLVLSALIFFKKNAPPYLWVWLIPFTLVRWIKNWVEARWYKKDTTEAVGRAYREFYHGQ